jgi:putative addiction module component (TIGR02574 family)
MTQAVTRILAEVDRLSAAERAELTDHLVESLADEAPPTISQAQMTEIRRRIAEVEAGEDVLVSEEEAFAQIRRTLASEHRED